MALTASDAAGVVAAAQPQPAAPVSVASCQIRSVHNKRTDEVDVVVRFTNQTKRALTGIVFRTPFLNTTLDVEDDGSFAPGVQIDNYLGTDLGTSHTQWGTVALSLLARSPQKLTKESISLPIFISTPMPENCALVRAVSDDGTVWENPALDQMPADTMAAIAPLIFNHPAATPAPGATPEALPSASPAPGGLRIYSCGLSLAGRGYLTVRFANTGTKAIKHIVFRVPFQGGDLEFGDEGRFSPATLTVHSLKLNLPNGLGAESYQSYDGDPCIAASLIYADGTTWTNPLAAQPAVAPTAVPQPPIDAYSRWHYHAPLLPSPQPSPTNSAMQ